MARRDLEEAMPARPDPVLAWLLEPSQPSMRWLASRDLVRPCPSERRLARLRADVTERGWASAILAKQREHTWWAAKRTCYYPKFRSTIWQLQVLADLGCSRRDPRIANAVELWFRLHYDAKGGGFSPGAHEPDGRVYTRDAWTSRWAGASHLCTTGNMVRSLIRLGYLEDERVQTAIEWLVRAQLPDGGWDCFGRKTGTMDAWEAMSGLAEVPPRRRSRAVRGALARGAEFFLERGLLHEGPRFERWYWCRYPWHYHYDHLVGLDFITALGLGQDKRLEEAWVNLERKRQPDGRWRLDHTNGDLVVEPKGAPSKMVTFLALRAMRRAGRA
jgi:hypothetical protein